MQKSYGSAVISNLIKDIEAEEPNYTDFEPGDIRRIIMRWLNESEESRDNASIFDRCIFMSFLMEDHNVPAIVAEYFLEKAARCNYIRKIAVMLKDKADIKAYSKRDKYLFNSLFGGDAYPKIILFTYLNRVYKIPTAAANAIIYTIGSAINAAMDLIESCENKKDMYYTILSENGFSDDEINEAFEEHIYLFNKYAADNYKRYFRSGSSISKKLGDIICLDNRCQAAIVAHYLTNMKNLPSITAIMLANCAYNDDNITDILIDFIMTAIEDEGESSEDIIFILKCYDIIKNKDGEEDRDCLSSCIWYDDDDDEETDYEDDEEDDCTENDEDSDSSDECCCMNPECCYGCGEESYDSIIDKNVDHKFTIYMGKSNTKKSSYVALYNKNNLLYALASNNPTFTISLTKPPVNTKCRYIDSDKAYDEFMRLKNKYNLNHVTWY